MNRDATKPAAEPGAVIARFKARRAQDEARRAALTPEQRAAAEADRAALSDRMQAEAFHPHENPAH